MEHGLRAQDLPLPGRGADFAGRDHPDRCGEGGRRPDHRHLHRDHAAQDLPQAPPPRGQGHRPDPEGPGGGGARGRGPAPLHGLVRPRRGAGRVGPGRRAGAQAEPGAGGAGRKLAPHLVRPAAGFPQPAAPGRGGEHDAGERGGASGHREGRGLPRRAGRRGLHREGVRLHRPGQGPGGVSRRGGAAAGPHLPGGQPPPRLHPLAGLRRRRSVAHR